MPDNTALIISLRSFEPPSLLLTFVAYRSCDIFTRWKKRLIVTAVIRIQTEKLLSNAMTCPMQGGKVGFYRICDDPEDVAVGVDVCSDEMLDLRGIYRCVMFALKYWTLKGLRGPFSASWHSILRLALALRSIGLFSTYKFSFTI